MMKQITTTLPELVTPNQLAERYAIAHHTAIKVLTAAKIKPAHEQKVGRSNWKLYKRDEALPVLDKHIAESNPASNPTPAKDSSAVTNALLTEQIETLETLVEGNRVMFGLMQQMAKHVEHLVKELGVKSA